MTKQELDEKWKRENEILDEVIRKKNNLINFFHDKLTFKDCMTVIMLMSDYDDSVKKLYEQNK